MPPHGLGKVAVIDRVPEWVRLAGLAAFDRRELSVRVADVDFDSLMASTTAEQTRTLRFTSDAETITVDVTATGPAVRLAIEVSPPRTVRLDVRPIHGRVTHLWTDGHGSASCSDVPSGPFSVLVHWPRPIGPVRTAWVQI